MERAHSKSWQYRNRDGRHDKMSLERCPNGHVYNARRYGKICPYCNMKLAGEDEEKKPVGFEPPVELLEE